tara:strand:- start:83 stop:283 length:201 start_codon:yes stop_codon:yes gene_type:complete
MDFRKNSFSRPKFELLKVYISSKKISFKGARNMKLASLPKFFLKKRGVRVSDYGLQIEKTSFKDKY